MKTHLIKMGKSQGIRIPRLLLEQSGLTGEVEVEAQEGQLIIRPVRSPRQDWDAQFQAMVEVGEDRLLNLEPLSLTAWEDGEWEW